MVSVPDLAAPVLTATVNATVVLPLPDDPLLSVSQPTLALAVHAQLAADAVSATEPDPPVSGTFCSVGAIEKVHGGGGGAAA
jgi:hypothetical protein